LAANQIGDLTAFIGIFVTIGGFVLTLVRLSQSKRAAEAATKAANEARQSIAYVATISDFSAAIAILEEIKRFHRGGVLGPLPDRYSTLRKLLIGVSSSRNDLVGAEGLSEDQREIIQRALVNLSGAESAVERSMHNGTALDFPRLNRLLSKDLDQLETLLVHLKSLAGGR
jgi:hypothetical protein